MEKRNPLQRWAQAVRPDLVERHGRWFLSDPCDDRLAQVVRHAHRDLLPDHSVYAAVATIIGHLADSESFETVEFWEEAFLDTWEADIYMTDLLRWLTPTTIGYVDEVLDDKVHDEFCALIRESQYRQIEDVLDAIHADLEGILVSGEGQNP